MDELLFSSLEVAKLSKHSKLSQLDHFSSTSTQLNKKGFLPCQTPTSTVKLKVEYYRVKNGGCRIKGE